MTIEEVLTWIGDPKEDASARLDRIADWFHRETGYWHPGRDAPAELRVNEEECRGVWALWAADKWTKTHEAIIALAERADALAEARLLRPTLADPRACTCVRVDGALVDRCDPCAARAARAIPADALALAEAREAVIEAARVVAAVTSTQAEADGGSGALESLEAAIAAYDSARGAKP